LEIERGAAVVRETYHLMGTAHRYHAHCSWSGSTAGGYDLYRREHEAEAPPAANRLSLSGDPAFGGDPACLNPEQLLVLAAASCQLLSFLAVAARARLDVVAYDDDALGEMPDDAVRMSLTRILLRPRITLVAPADEGRVRHLVLVAHRECYIANSLKTEVLVEPTIIEAFPPST
jgi:organic hydroperoxide reductase OsmC/OhrA